MTNGKKKIADTPFRTVGEAEKAFLELGSVWSQESTNLTRMSLLNLRQNERIIRLLKKRLVLKEKPE